MGATEDFLAELQKKRKAQLSQIGQLFNQRTGGDTSPMEQPALRKSLLGGILKTRPSESIGLASPPQSPGSAGGGGAAGPLSSAAGVLGNTPVGGGGIAGGAGAGMGLGAGQMTATQMPIMAGMLGQAPTAAAGNAGATAASSGIGGGLGQALSSGAGAVSGAVGAAVSKVAELIASLFSSRRLKHEIETYMQIKDLRWVFFKYLPAVDPDQTPLLGLIAEEVYLTRPEVVCLDELGDPIAINYDLIPDEDWPSLEQAHQSLMELPWQ